MAKNLTTEYQLIDSKNIGTDQYTGTIELRLYAKCNSYDIANNQTTVDVKLVHYVPRTYIVYGSSSQTLTGDISQSSSNPSNKRFNAGETILLSESSTITHNNDGTKTISIGGTFTNSFFSNTTTISNVDCILPTIPRATNSPLFVGYVEKTIYTQIYPKSINFSHSVAIYFPSNTFKGYLDADGNIQVNEYKFPAGINNIPFICPSSFYNLFNGNNAYGKAILKTYNGSTLVGESYYNNNLSINIDAVLCLPTFNATIQDINPTTTDLTNNANNIIAGYSITRITPNIQYISSHNDNNATLLQKTIINTQGQTIDFTNDNYYDDENANLNSYKIYVKNSRLIGYTKDISLQGTLIPYFKPVINRFLFKRNTDVGENMYLTFNGNFYNDYFDIDNNQNLNTLTIKWYVRKSESDNWTLGGTLTSTDDEQQTSNYDYYINSSTFETKHNISLTNPFSETGLNVGEWDYKQKYYFKIEIVDLLNTALNPIYGLQYVKIGLPIYNWYRDNDENYFNINGHLMINNEPLDEKSAIMVYLSSNATLTCQTAFDPLTIPFDTVRFNFGNKFTLNNDGTISYTGTKKLKASALITISSSSGNVYTRILDAKNGLRFQEYGGTSGQYRVETLTDGNTIYASIGIDSAGSVVVTGSANQYTCLIVEEL